jgi:hypothetical protein
MFSDATNGADVVRRFEQYKGALSAEHQKATNGGRVFAPGLGRARSAGRPPTRPRWSPMTWKRRPSCSCRG